MRRSLICLLCGCLLATTTSCSILFVKAPPSYDPIASDNCTESRVAPYADTAFVGFTALLLALLVTRCTNTGGNNQDGTPNTGCDRSQWMALGWTGVVGLGVAYSAYTGFRDTKSCRRRRALELTYAQSP